MVFSQIPHMTYQQYRTARRLVHECCNYDCGNCLLLDSGEECVCPQSITYSLICKWFRDAAGSVVGHLPCPGTTPFTALSVLQTVPNAASGYGQGKTGLECRKGFDRH